MVSVVDSVALNQTAHEIREPSIRSVLRRPRDRLSQPDAQTVLRKDPQAATSESAKTVADSPRVVRDPHGVSFRNRRAQAQKHDFKRQRACCHRRPECRWLSVGFRTVGRPRRSRASINYRLSLPVCLALNRAALGVLEPQIARHGTEKRLFSGKTPFRESIAPSASPVRSTPIPAGADSEPTARGPAGGRPRPPA